MSWSFSIGRLFGSDLRIHVTFFLLLGWIGYAAYVQDGAQAALDNVLFVVALFACVVAHEFGHALTARRYGIRTPTITLLPIGGMAQLEKMPEKPGQEIAVALAGPAVNIVIWAALTLLGAKGISDLSAELDAGGNASFLSRLAALNLFLALFNLIPAFPMDGGRVFRALLALMMTRVQATQVAATAGQIVAFLFGFWGLSSGNPILVLIAIFIFMAANAESQDVEMRSLARKLKARDAMITAYESLTPADTLDTAASALIRTTQHEFPVVDVQGQFQGFLTRSALFSALAHDHPRTQPVSEIMVTDVPSLPLTAGLDKVLDALHKSAPAVVVVDARGQMLGYITNENVGELMVLKAR
ncbi:site-2 protease family protein [Pseudodonghicola flavimaris]|uniref:Zinc metalloprotease n=1 Tax=Pseudodonghicola flavimaris TaxID=3050036 RepID=A0ABT7F7R7_9RHOB|nr:site-2 protease family protein [Pseudodonghicola flavimaris]MDK3020652.1 site-2 protease family protein [Pseudodonghicola flavimaris]